MAEVTTRSPSLTPSRISTVSSLRRPILTSVGTYTPSPLSRKMTCLTPVSRTASFGTTKRALVSVVSKTVPYMPGFNLRRGFGISRRTRIVRVASFTYG